MNEWISGRNPVFEILKAGRRKATVLRLAEGVKQKGRLAEIIDLAKERGIPIESVPRRELDKFSPNHQGISIQAETYPYTDVAAIIGRSDPTARGIILILDTIQDPQNLGTLLRTAEAVQARGVLLPLSRTATVTPAVVQASSGATEYLQIAQANLAMAIERLKDNDYWVVGLENSPEACPPDEVRLDGRMALVVGSEGSGMRRLVRESCDLLMRLPIQGQVGSLNAAVAGSIALFLAWAAQDYRKNS